MSDSRIKRDMKDTKKIPEFMGARDPFSQDSTLRSIVTGVIADNRVNVDKAKEVGQNILKTMTHKNTEEYTFKKDKQAITMDRYIISEVIHKEIQVDPQLLFQRLITVRNYANEDVDVLFKLELCAVPASLFEPNGLPKKANKAILAEAIWKVINANVEYPRQLTVQYVLDGGSLLQRLPWKRGSKFSSIYDSYVFYVIKKYNKAVVVFDGYEHGPAPKDVTDHRRTGLSQGIEVKFSEDIALVLKKEVFLATKKNKQLFINILGKKLEDAGCTVHHALGDADHLIVKKAVELSETTDTILVGEDTDLLVLLLHYASQNTKKIFLCSEPKQNVTRRSKVWDIQLCQQALGSDVCESILFIHAILGCDTTSSLYRIGKGLSLKAFMRKEQFKQQAITFSNELS